MKRMDRYNETSEEKRVSRSKSNQDLYDNIGNNTRYTNFSEIVNSNAIDLDNTKNYNKRENYHKIKEYENVVYTPKIKKELDDTNLKMASPYTRTNENGEYEVWEASFALFISVWKSISIISILPYFTKK